MSQCHSFAGCATVIILVTAAVNTPTEERKIMVRVNVLSVFYLACVTDSLEERAVDLWS